MLVKKCTILFLGTIALEALACDVTLPAGSSFLSVQSALNSAAYSKICLAPGSYAFASTLVVPQGKMLAGMGANPAETKITSSADRAIRALDYTTLHKLKVVGTVGSPGTYGVLYYYNTAAKLWSVEIEGYKINLGIKGSSGITILNSFFRLNGVPNNGVPEPNIWISDSVNINVRWGAVYGRGDKPFGDGEISCYNSAQVRVDGVYSFDSGTSAIYFVNCDDSSVRNSAVYRAGGFGLDIVNGSDNFVADNNLIQWSHYAGTVFHAHLNSGGVFRDNRYVDNNRSGDGRFCNGIAHRSSLAGLSMSGNTFNPYVPECVY